MSKKRKRKNKSNPTCRLPIGDKMVRFSFDELLKVREMLQAMIDVLSRQNANQYRLK